MISRLFELDPTTNVHCKKAKIKRVKSQKVFGVSNMVMNTQRKTVTTVRFISRG